MGRHLSTVTGSRDSVPTRRRITHGLQWNPRQINRDDILKAAFFNQGGVLNGMPIPPSSPFYDEKLANFWSYNPDKAKQMLDAAGWTVGSDGVRAKNGQRLSLKYQSTSAGIRLKTMPLVKDQLSRVGIEMNIENLPAQTYRPFESGGRWSSFSK